MTKRKFSVGDKVRVKTFKKPTYFKYLVGRTGVVCSVPSVPNTSFYKVRFNEAFNRTGIFKAHELEKIGTNNE